MAVHAEEDAPLMQNQAIELSDLESQDPSGQTPCDSTSTIDDLEKPAREEQDGSDDPGNPLNWPEKKKWTHILIVGSLVFSV